VLFRLGIAETFLLCLINRSVREDPREIPVWANGIIIAGNLFQSERSKFSGFLPFEFKWFVLSSW